MNGQQGETTPFLIDTAQQHGHRVTAGMLKKWHLFGLLPRPKQKQLGRNREGKSLGSVTIYPPRTLAQLLRLLEMRSEGGRFNPERALWRLWWEGWPVDPESIRSRLGVESQQSNIAEVVRTLATEPLPPPLARMRKRAAADMFATLIKVMFQVLDKGVVGNWRLKSTFDALYKAGGLRDLRRSVSQEQMPDSGGTAVPGGPKPVIQSVIDLWVATSRDARNTAILEADGNALEQARRDLHTVATVTRDVWPVVSSLPEFSKSNAGRDLITHYQRAGFDALPCAVSYVLALRRVQVYAELFDLLSERAETIAVDVARAIRGHG